MKPRVNLITLGVADLPRSRAFYENGLGWPVAEAAGNESVVFIQLDNLILSLFSQAALAEDAHLPNERGRFDGLTLACNLPTKQAVDEAMQVAERAGAQILKPAQDVFWGGYCGYFADPDGHAWEVAWNPFFPMDEEGRINLLAMPTS